MYQKNQNTNEPSNKLSLDRRNDGVLISKSQSEQRLTAGQHIPVLLSEVLHFLEPRKGEFYLDLTAGYGGHAKEIMERTFQPKQAVLVDRDQKAIDYLEQQFAGKKPEIIHQDFASVVQELSSKGRQFDIILADLGVSSPHLDSASRGFSVRLDGPLDMRMDQSKGITASDIVNNYDEAKLVEIIRRYGEEPRANRIAREIVAHRPITTTQQLAKIVASSAGWRSGSKHHPAIRTFQALRIVVNDELAQIEISMPTLIKMLKPNGRIAVISFHSLEDRLIKRAFADEAGDRYDSTIKLLTKQPVTASDAELVFNPRARSAKLRAAVKIKKKGE